MSTRYQSSEALLERALRHIPLGSQTFSKSRTQFPQGAAPFFIREAKGSHCRDVDGNEYIDFINGLAAVTLGHQDADVTQSVKEQLKKGVIFSLPHPIETEVAEEISKIVPGAENVRFGKNGSDATSGAIRLARAYTNREHVAACGYHGWQDWYIGATARHRGVPQSTRDLTHLFIYNKIETLEKIFSDYPGKVAAVIMEPMNSAYPENDFLEKAADLTRKNGALLIWDETITGFRYAKGGAQEYFGIEADLATFGKGLANGYPVSAVTGKKKFMSLMEEIFFSFTFGGEALSLAAAFATLKKIQKEPVIETLSKNGGVVVENVRRLIAKNKMESVLSISGHPSWSFLRFEAAGNYTPLHLQTLFLQEMFARGILILTTHNMSYAHTKKDLDRLLAVYEEVFPLIKNAIETNSLESKLRCKVLEPLFKLR